MTETAATAIWNEWTSFTLHLTVKLLISVVCQKTWNWRCHEVGYITQQKHLCFYSSKTQP